LCAEEACASSRQILGGFEFAMQPRRAGFNPPVCLWRVETRRTRLVGERDIARIIFAWLAYCRVLLLIIVFR
jgi:hypothetical protein